MFFSGKRWGVTLTSRNFEGDYPWKFQWNFVMKFHLKVSSEFHDIWNFNPNFPDFCRNFLWSVVIKFNEISFESRSDFDHNWNSVVLNMRVLASRDQIGIPGSQLSLLKHQRTNASSSELIEVREFQYRFPSVK